MNKRDGNGKLLWSRSIGSLSDDVPGDLQLDALGNLYLTGGYQGNLTIGDTVLNTVGNYSLFLAKFDSSGALCWALREGGTGRDFGVGVGICVDSTESVLLTGFGGDHIFDSFIPQSKMFLARYSAEEIRQWTTRITGTGFGYNATGLVLDRQRNIYMYGQFEDTLRFGDVSLGSTDKSDSYFVKFNTLGEKLWVRSISGPRFQEAQGLLYSDTAGLTLFGTYTNPANFGTLTLPIAFSGSASFIARYTTDGTCLWAKSVGNAGDNTVACGAYDYVGNLYIVGTSNQSLTLGSFVLPGFGTTDGFVARLGEAPLAAAPRIESPIRLFPNPAAGYFSATAEVHAIRSLQVYDGLGKCVYQTRSNFRDIPVDTWPAGVYRVEVEMPGSIYRTRIAVTR